MNLKLRVWAVIFCGLLLSGCVVSKSKLDESLAKCTLLESDLRAKEQDLVKHTKEISTLADANKNLVADAEKAKQLSNEELTKAKATQEKIDAELLTTKGQVVEKDKEITAVKSEVVARNKELLAFKDEMTKQLLEKDKATEDVIYRVREIQARAESLLEKIKTIQ